MDFVILYHTVHTSFNLILPDISNTFFDVLLNILYVKYFITNPSLAFEHILSFVDKFINVPLWSSFYTACHYKVHYHDNRIVNLSKSLLFIFPKVLNIWFSREHNDLCLRKIRWINIQRKNPYFELLMLNEDVPFTKIILFVEFVYYFLWTTII